MLLFFYSLGSPQFSRYNYFSIVFQFVIFHPNFVVTIEREKSEKVSRDI